MSQFVGRVVGTKMQKTAKVEVCRMFLHPQVLKVSLRGEEYDTLWTSPPCFDFSTCSISSIARCSLPMMNVRSVWRGTWS